MNELMMCPLPFMVSVKDSWAEEDEVCTVYAIREYRGTEFLIYYNNEWTWMDADRCRPVRE
jgi:hypothetical protein